MSKQELQLKYMSRDQTKLKQEIDEHKSANALQAQRIEELKDGKSELLNENIKLTHKIQELEDKAKQLSSSVSYSS